MLWSRPASATFVVGIALAGCAKFGEAPGEAGGVDGGAGDGSALEAGTCVVDTCDGRGPSCRAYVFGTSPPCPPADWHFSGDSLPGTVRECTADGIHVAAKDTLDVVAELDLDLPKVLDAVRVSLRFSIAKWDGKGLLELGGRDLVHFVVSALEDARGEMQLALCVATRDGPKDCVPLATTTPKADHVLELELDRSGVVARVDCGQGVRHEGTAFGGGGSFHVGFGHVEGDPFDGSLAAMTISFR